MLKVGDKVMIESMNVEMNGRIGLIMSIVGIRKNICLVNTFSGDRCYCYFKEEILKKIDM